jgi:soluble lytic murein transglycosylase
MRGRNLVGDTAATQAKTLQIGNPRRKSYRHALVWLLASSLIALGAAEGLSAPRHKAASVHRKKGVSVARHKGKGERNKVQATKRPRHVIPRAVAGEPASPPPATLVTVKQALDLVRQGKGKDAIALAASTGDPAAAKLIEWARLRNSDSDVRFDSYAAFIAANPDWPSTVTMRKRAEVRLWQEHRDAETVRSFIGEVPPLTPMGRLALARIALQEGDRAAAETEVREVWQSAVLSAEIETTVVEAFPGMLTRADHVARMDRRIGAKDFAGAMRAAKHLGDDYVKIVKACSATMSKSSKSGSLLDGVSSELRGDLGYALCRLTYLLRNDTPGSNIRGRIVTPKENIAAAVKLTLAASPKDLRRQDADEWWRARRALARKLLDLGEATTAYRVVRASAPPANQYYQAEVHFMAGWIALRFLDDPAAAREHFSHIDEGKSDPLILARGAYWRGRAAEAAGDVDDMQAQYEMAASYPTAYYGQLARARLGFADVVVARNAPEPADANENEVLRAAGMLYKLAEGDLAMSFLTDVAAESNDPSVISGVGELAVRYNDAQAMLLLGKTALSRGLPMDRYAFPDVGVPQYSFPLDRCIVYAIVRTESGFDQNDKSAAKAVGLMQVTPDAGRDTAKRFGFSYDWKKLVSDPVYNTKMGAAELSALLKDYRGSLVMTFAGYNAGRGRVQQWVAQHGDPRDPKVDAVDWVERIPFSETRNYVQRVMENLQVYRKRFGEQTATVEPNLHRAAVERPAEPTAAVEQAPEPVAVVERPLDAAALELEQPVVPVAAEPDLDQYGLAASRGVAGLFSTTIP